ncbi:MAG: cytochrome c [Planctomycetota bacterium]
MNRLTSIILTGLAAAACVAPLAGCRGDRTDKPPRRFFPGMDDQPKWDAQEQTDFFTDSRTLRPQVQNTVAFGSATFNPETYRGAEWAEGFLAERDTMLAENDGVFRGVSGTVGDDVTYLDYIPVRVTEEMLLKGQERFNIYCSACHGYLGDGTGMVGRRWSYSPANLLGEVYQDRSTYQGKDGYLFHTILNGVWGVDGANRMPGYAHAIDEMEAWAIVAYLRALQTSQSASLDELDAGDRQRLEATRGVANAAPAAADDASDGMSEEGSE